MDANHVNDNAELLKALAHPTRLQIVHELLMGIRCVTDIQDILPASQSNISQHLTVLRHARVVDFVQDGAQRCYYVSRPQTVQAIVAALTADEPVLRKNKQDVAKEKEQAAAACGVCCGA
jgi:ArsR family transcriptional regulator